VQNCYVTGIITGNAHVGGIAGENSSSGVIESSYFNGSITSNGGNNGGIVGLNAPGGAIVRNSYSTGSITSSSINVGGIAGSNSSIVTLCFSTAIVTGSNIVGGIVGNSETGASVENCVALNNSVRATTWTSSIGRVIGNNNGTLTNSRAWSDMDIRTNVGSDGTGGTAKPGIGNALSHVDGLGITTAEARTRVTWETPAPAGAGFQFGTTPAAPWVWDGTNMPRLWNSPVQPWPTWLVDTYPVLPLQINFTLTNPLHDPLNVPAPITIHRDIANGATSAIITINNPGHFSSIEWFYNNNSLGTGYTITINAADFNTTGIKLITVEGITNQSPPIPYSRIITVTVAP
jgi:hypothetical protein